MHRRIIFPNIEEADADGLLAIGGNTDAQNLLEAYRLGIFPWPWTDEYLAWFCPPKRAILKFADYHVSNSLKKFLKKTKFTYKRNENFEQVLIMCKETRERLNVKGHKPKGTWITSDVINGYLELHKLGHAVSYETFLDNKLVGGLYGVSINKYFSGESMFHIVENASKAAMYYAVVDLSTRGVSWIDCQVLNPHTQSIGASEIDRDQFISLLDTAIGNSKPLS